MIPKINEKRKSPFKHDVPDEIVTKNVDGQTELVDRITKAYLDNPLIFGMERSPAHFRGPTPWFHLEVVKECEANRFLAIAAPRESAKSTIVAFLKPLHSICFKRKRFIIILSNTYTKAVGTLDAIKKEITDNPNYKSFHIRLLRDAAGDAWFMHKDKFVTRVLCKGSEQIGSIRGEKFGAYRPDLIVVDDLEDDELVRNPERRRDLQSLFDEALIPAGDKELCQYLVIGTILHDDSQMAKLINPDMYKEFKKLTYRALLRNVDGSLESLWSYKWTVEELLKLRQEKPDVFAKEYQNNPVSGLRQKFHKEDFRYWRIENDKYYLFGTDGEVVSKGNLCDCRGAIAGDLAWEEKKESDFSVIQPAYLTPQSDILLDTYVCKKGMRPSEIEEILFTMEERMRLITGSTIYIGFEKAKLEKVIKFLLRQAMVRRNHWLNFKDILWDSDKVTRIETKLEPRYAQHSIYHKHGMGELEGQLLRFPSAAHDDLPDAVAGVVSILQFPKSAKKVEVQENEFNWWRKQALENNAPKRNKFIYGNKRNKFVAVPFKQAFK